MHLLLQLTSTSFFVSQCRGSANPDMKHETCNKMGEQQIIELGNGSGHREVRSDWQGRKGKLTKYSIIHYNNFDENKNSIFHKNGCYISIFCGHGVCCSNSSSTSV